MMYSNKFVMCVLVNGQPQTEKANGVVTLPFGSEYALRFRNKHSRRAVVQIYIDGENVSGAGYVVPANDYVDIKRHHDKDRAFKFVSLDSPDAVDAGKNGPNQDKVKGTIEARFYLEKERPAPPVYIPYPVDHHHHHHHHHDHYHPPTPAPWIHYPQIWCSKDSGGTTYRGAGGSSARGMSAGSPMSYNAGADYASTGGAELLGFCDSGQHTNCVPPPAKTATCSVNEAPVLKDGCTVEGNMSGQRFTSTWVETEDSYTSVKIFLQGFEAKVEAVAPAAPVAAEEGKYCHNCGAKVAKKSANFCHVCGAKL